MRGKYAKKKKKSSLWLVLILVLAVLAVFAVLGFLASGNREQMPLPTEPEDTTAQSVPSETTQPATEPAFTVEEELEGATSFSLDRGLEIVRYGKYIGAYMEDGTDEIVANVMMIEVHNTGEHPIQYAKITVTGPAGDAVFTLTTLMPGQRIIVLEAGRKAYSETDVYTEARADNVAFFAESPSLQEDKVQIQPLEGGFNISNVSGEDITGQICVYFKDVSGDMLYGGITYLVRIDGLAAGEVKQVMSANFTEKNSRVMFIQIIGQ